MAKKTHGKCVRKGKSHGRVVCRKFAKVGSKRRRARR